MVGAAEWLGTDIENSERCLSVLPMLPIDLSKRVTLHLVGSGLAEIKNDSARLTFPIIPACGSDSHSSGTERRPFHSEATRP